MPSHLLGPFSFPARDSIRSQSQTARSSSKQPVVLGQRNTPVSSQASPTCHLLDCQTATRPQVLPLPGSDEGQDCCKLSGQPSPIVGERDDQWMAPHSPGWPCPTWPRPLPAGKRRFRHCQNASCTPAPRPRYTVPARVGLLSP